MLKRIAALLIMLTGTTSLWAQGAGEAAVPFLLINPGARAGGMGEAGVALATDATAIYWNPGGLAFQYNDPETDHPGEVSLMHAKWLPQFNFSDLFYDFLAARYYVDDIGMLGLGITFLNLGENVATSTTGQEYDRFRSQEYAFTLSYATRIQSNLGLGVNLKLIRSELAPESINVGNESTNGRATGVAVDVGVLWKPDYDMFDNKLTLGANLSNFGPAIFYNDEAQSDPLPTNLRLGLAYDLLDDEFNQMTLIYDANKPLYRRDGSKAENFITAAFYSSWVKGKISDRWNAVTHSVGLEYVYGNLIALRTGYFYEHEQAGGRQFLTFGAGLKYDIFRFDFGYISDDKDSPLSDTIRYSLAVQF
ncbi:MAG: hypothetical protein D6677_10185 [Calditrichaeota bacterium]|nr:MAG: hypothetical protein D6677_10185 [Calditrichota bacterium]